MNETLQKNLTAIENSIAIQRNCIPTDNANQRAYMVGMLNGMIFSKSIFTSEAPTYYSNTVVKTKNKIRHKNKR